jgi:membrane fusion protein (multidrug efflux system)
VRYVVAIVGVLMVLGALAGIKWAQISTLMAFGAEAESAGPPPEAVGARAAEEQSWEIILPAVGTVESERGVTVAAEVPGVVEKIAFDSGAVVRKGQVLVTLDTDVERAQLAEARAQRGLADINAGRFRKLAAADAVPVSQRDQAETELEALTARVASLEAQIARKVVRAPFSGRLGIRQVDLGEYLAAGAPIAALETTDVVFVDFTVPQQRLSEVKAGMPVRIVVDGRAEVSGAVAAVSPALDSATRAVRLRAEVKDGAEQLRSGMFAQVGVVLDGRSTIVAIPATAVVHAPYGDSVFVLEDKPADAPGARQAPGGEPVLLARQRFVRIGPRRGDFVAVLEGVEAGEQVVTAGAFKLRNGSPVFVTEEAIPAPELAPRPPNR